MKKQAAIDFFGSQRKLAAALGIAQPSVANWPDIVPELWQLKIEAITRGRVKADPAIKQPKIHLESR